ncbi:Atp-binding protein, partial [Globisporangium polare]
EGLKEEWARRRVDIAETAANDDASAGLDTVLSDDEDDNDIVDSRLHSLGQVGVLAARNATRIIRDKVTLGAVMFLTVVISLIVGLIFLQLDLNQTGIQNFAGALFYIVVNQTFSIAEPTFIAVPLELPIIIREYQAGLYHLLSWYIAKNISELPMQIFLPVVFFTPVYFLVGIGHGFSTYFYMQLIMILVSSCAIGIGYMVSCLARRVELAPVIGVVVVMTLSIFGGLLINSDDCPVYFVWIQYISPIKYGFEAMMKLYWGKVDSIPCNEAIENCAALAGPEVLQNYSMTSRTAFSDAVILLAINLGFRAVGFLGLWLSVRRTK